MYACTRVRIFSTSISQSAMPPKSPTRSGGARGISVSSATPKCTGALKGKNKGDGGVSVVVAGKQKDAGVVSAVAAGKKKVAGGDGAVAVSTRQSPQRASRSTGLVKAVEAGGVLGLVVPSLPPLWNAWWCGSCRALHPVGDGGELTGECKYCSEISPVRNDTMLDPEQFKHLRNIGSGTVIRWDEDGKVVDDVQDSSSLASASEFSTLSMANNEYKRTDHEVSMFSFFERLHHYMDRNRICDENRRSVELAMMVEAGSIVREMGTMTKERRENSFHEEYMNLISEIPSEFLDDDVRQLMQLRFKGMRKGGDINPTNLLRKYETEMAPLKKMAYKFPGFSDVSKLPSGTSQLQQLRQPVITKLWAEQNQDRLDIDFDDPVAVAKHIPPTWWLEHHSCRYILSILVHKDNKDICTQPTKLPAGPKRKDIRKAKKAVVEKERATERTERLIGNSVTRSGSVVASTMSVNSEKEHADQQAKKAKIDGMRCVINLKKIEAINTQIQVMERLENVYVKRMGRDAYESKLVNLANKLPDMHDEEEEQESVDVGMLTPHCDTSVNDD